MDKRVILAVAGSGKTTEIINRIDLENKILLITYTNNNFYNLRNGIVKKFSYFPKNVSLYTYFSFLYSFCFNPLLSYKYRAKGINYNRNPNRYIRQTSPNYYFDKYGRIYGNRIAKFFETRRILSEINARISKYFDKLFIDEIQDFAGHDFNLLKSICQADLEMTFVGDFYQHTFDTSRDGNVNKNLFNDYEQYKTKLQNMGLVVDYETLNRSFRCSPTLCDFIAESLGIEIKSHRKETTTIHVVSDQRLADELYHCKEIIKLFYKEHHKYECYSKNWGESKGDSNHKDVCVVINKTTYYAFLNNKLIKLPQQTINKFYVACSRAKNDLFLVSEDFYRNYKC